ncbi:MAG: hypothetical protein KGM44_04855 [bacterium]|nr:hypothetical protein [bacterium]
MMIERVLSAALPAAFAAAVTMVATTSAAVPSVAATPAPTLPPFVKKSPPPLPDIPLHAEVLVRTNGKGEAAGAKMKRFSGNGDFDFVALHNASQIIIKTEKGKIVVGTFDVSYDYTPGTHATKRSVTLISRGGDPNAPGIAQTEMKHELRRQVEWDMKHPAAAPVKE